MSTPPNSLPDGWQERPMGVLLAFSNGINADKSAYGSGVPFANVLEVITHDALNTEQIPGRITVTPKVLKRYEVKYGDVLLNRTSETQEEVGLTSVYLGDEPIVFGGFVFRGRPITEELTVSFSKYAFRSPVVRRQIVASGQGGIRSNIGQRDLKSVLVPVPPRPEQESIAEVLDDLGRLVSQLERLVAKKRDVKQGMMQELLTGRTRLPGFAGDWQTHRIGDFAQVKAGGTPSTRIARYWGGDIRWMNSGEIHQKRVHEVAGRITVDGLRESAAQLLPVGTVLMALAGQGKTRGTVAVSRVELSTNQSIAGILPSGRHYPDFVFYNLDARYDEVRGESSGDGGRGGLNLTIIKRLTIYMPDVPEQAAIADVLSDVDDELDALERRLAKARAVRHGMMQELLTGQTRLPAEGAAA